jgi:hypothetical protein
VRVTQFGSLGGEMLTKESHPRCGSSAEGSSRWQADEEVGNTDELAGEWHGTRSALREVLVGSEN